MNYAKMIFLFPGQILTWIEYMFPARGFSAVAGSGRRYRSMGVKVLYSLLVWAALAGFIAYKVNTRGDYKTPTHNQPIVESDIKELFNKAKKPLPKSDSSLPIENTRPLPLSSTEISAIRAQFAKCWSVPAGAANVDELQVMLRVQLAEDGSVIQVELADESKSHYAADSFYRAAADSAMRAVRQCSPIKNLPPEKYQAWRDIIIKM